MYWKFQHAGATNLPRFAWAKTHVGEQNGRRRTAEITGSEMREPRGQNDRGCPPALVVLCAGQLMIVLDQTIVNVALPSTQAFRSLVAPAPGASWAYLSLPGLYGGVTNTRV